MLPQKSSDCPGLVAEIKVKQENLTPETEFQDHPSSSTEEEEEEAAAVMGI